MNILEFKVNVEEAAGLLALLADETRLMIAACIFDEGLSIASIATASGLPPTIVAHHLTEMTEAGIVSKRADGMNGYYVLVGHEARSLVEHILRSF